jgi:hypothetical protein
MLENAGLKDYRDVVSGSSVPMIRLCTTTSVHGSWDTIAQSLGQNEYGQLAWYFDDAAGPRDAAFHLLFVLHGSADRSKAAEWLDAQQAISDAVSCDDNSKWYFVHRTSVGKPDYEGPRDCYERKCDQQSK